MDGQKSEGGASFSSCSEMEYDDFSHQRFGCKLAETEELKKSSTFPEGLLLLLVL